MIDCILSSIFRLRTHLKFCTAFRGAQHTMPRHRRRRAAQPKESSKRRNQSDTTEAQSRVTLFSNYLVTHVPNFSIFCIAIAAGYYELFTHGDYANSVSLLSFLKQVYLFYVCVTCRVKIWPLIAPSVSRKSREKAGLLKLVWAEMKLFICVLAVSCAGTSVIQPIYNEWPHYRAISTKCAPLFIVSELLFGYLKLPMDFVLAGIGLALAWYKSITMKSLAREWEEAKDATLIHFVLVMTANLFASAFLTQVLVYALSDSSRRSAAHRNALSSMVTSVCTATLAGLIAYVASHQHFLARFGFQALFLDILLALLLLHKYWKSRIEHLLTTKHKQS
uniref:Uncharacterized protein AlNc14C1G25 n=1 Tax=Albugo laibachii Nc14 TaxID=890382 RepID=F0VYL8_9STRA|nr:conserved hypothetical protein [Albugo laibachii Nc14]|eukprot:CCA13882.1 conserved hypothetical protein [Albugo laibachii Nc14]